LDVLLVAHGLSLCGGCRHRPLLDGSSSKKAFFGVHKTSSCRQIQPAQSDCGTNFSASAAGAGWDFYRPLLELKVMPIGL
jgi:hypothetical protein